MEALGGANRRRPKLVWVVLLWFLFSAGYTIISFLLVYAGAIVVTPEQAAYLKGLSLLDHALTLAIASLNVAGAVAMFLLRRIAFHLFVASLLASIAVTGLHAATKGFVAALGGGGAVGMLVGYAILCAVCVYAWKLKSRGVLV